MTAKYIKSFDGLRALAILLVMVFHGSYGLFPGGFIGVDLFFVLSGYLITSLLYEEYKTSGTISFSKFYIRRALRLFPVLIVCVVLANALWPYTPLDPGHNRRIATLASLFYFNNLVIDYICGNMNHLWSLSVEEHFYFIWPVTVFFFLFRISERKRIAVLIALILTLTIFRIVTLGFRQELIFDVFWIDPYGFTLCRIDSIIMGALLFFLVSDEKIPSEAITAKGIDMMPVAILLVLFIAFGFGVGYNNPYWLNGGFVVTNIICTVAVFFAIGNPDHPLLTNNIIRWIGKRSYGIYAYHFPVFYFLEGFRLHHSAANFAVITLLRFTISFGIAAFSYDFIEQPILKYKNRYTVTVAEAIRS